MTLRPGFRTAITMTSAHASIAFWSGDDWEDYAKSLLCLRHSDFQDTPSDYRGDLGLDGFSRAQQRAYQCYAAEEPIDQRKLHENQQTKVRVDTQKLIDRHSEVRRLLGNCKLKCWTLVVPRFGSTPLVSYCTERANEILSLVDFVVDDFCITVEDHKSLDVEAAVYLGSAKRPLPLASPAIADHAQETFAASDAAFIETLRVKLSPLVPDEGKREKYIVDLVRSLLRGSNLEYSLREYGPLYQEFLTVKSRREASLGSLSMLTAGDPQRRLDHTLQRINEDLAASLAHLRPVDRDAIAEGCVVDWLGRCPLRLEA